MIYSLQLEQYWEHSDSPERLNDANINAQLVLLRPTNNDISSDVEKYIFISQAFKTDEIKLTGTG